MPCTCRSSFSASSGQPSRSARRAGPTSVACFASCPCRAARGGTCLVRQLRSGTRHRSRLRAERGTALRADGDIEDFGAEGMACKRRLETMAGNFASFARGMSYVPGPDAIAAVARSRGAPPDIFGEAFFVDPYPAYAAMRRGYPLYFDPKARAWILSRYEDVRLALGDPRRRAVARVLGVDLRLDCRRAVGRVDVRHAARPRHRPRRGVRARARAVERVRPGRGRLTRFARFREVRRTHDPS